MEISVISFTDKGKELSQAVFGSWTPEKVFLFSKKDSVKDVNTWTGEQFQQKRALVFVGACGIAVRMIAPWIKDKLTDSPVIVMDEAGLFVIPVLSGHMGGANELAERIAHQAGAVPVITTATDVNETFAVDVFARKQNLSVLNKDGIARVSSRVLKGEMVDIVISDDEEQLANGVLRLKPKEYVLGIGCRRGKPYEEIRDFVDKELNAISVSMQDVRAVASIDRKKDEEGILRFANANRLPFVTFSAEQLEQVSGRFEESDFVKNNVGVGNVCERAAMAEAGEGGRIVLHKTAEKGMTLAVAYAPWRMKIDQNDRLILETSPKQREEREEAQNMNNRIYIVGMGPGEEDMMTAQAIRALEESDVIIGYPVYLNLLGDRFSGKEFLSTPMRQETKRCQMCFEEAKKGKTVSMVCSGDAGIYGMASLLFELGKEEPETELVVIPGITAASSGAAVLGAPLNHDFCVISLSDLLTPWERIEKRLIAAAMGDFAMAIYNPSSHKRADYLQKACDILMNNGVEPERACGYVENIGREGTKAYTCTIRELRDCKVNMFTTVFIGNSQSEIVNGKLITKRGYQI